MGNRACLLRHQLKAKNSDQITCFDGFHRRLDKSNGQDTPPGVGVLDNAFRWIEDEEGLGAGVVLKSPKGDTLSYVLHIHFNATNNVEEYEALLHGLHITKDLGVR